MNIVIVGINDDIVKNFSFQLANQLNTPFIDASEGFNQILIANIDKSVVKYNDAFNKRETKLVQSLNNIKNAVIFMPNDMFLSNKNHIKLKNSIKISINFYPSNDLMKGIENLINKYCQIHLDYQNIDFNKIENILKGEK